MIWQMKIKRISMPCCTTVKMCIRDRYWSMHKAMKKSFRLSIPCNRIVRKEHNGNEREVNFMKIVAITSCATGIAHTYMAAEAIKKECKKKGYECKVEMQGEMCIRDSNGYSRRH